LRGLLILYGLDAYVQLLKNIQQHSERVQRRKDRNSVPVGAAAYGHAVLDCPQPLYQLVS